MLSKDEIFLKLQETLADMFGFQQEQIAMSTLLVDDLDIDSIDAVNVSIQLESFVGKKITFGDFKNIRTVEDVVDSMCLELSRS